LKIVEDIDLKKTKCSLNRPSAKDLEEETRKKLEQIFKNLNDKRAKADKELVEQVKKTWEGVGEARTILTLEQKNNFMKRWENINQLKTENQALKNNQTITSSEKEVKLNENQQKLEQLNAMIGSDNSNIQSPEQNNFPTSLVIGGGALVIAGLTAFLVIKNKKKKG
jgi:hypothetical protein